MREIQFENHLSEKVMEVVFPAGFQVETEADLLELKNAWTQNLKKWHSPYTCIFDVRDFQLAPERKADFERLLRFFKGFFMRKIIGFSGEAVPEGTWPFEVKSSYEEAVKETGLSRGGGLKRDLANLRDRIKVDNDFNAHVMEISFLAETKLATAEDVRTLKSKLQNMLMLWHTPYSVIFDCASLSFEEEARKEFERVERFLKGFFCKNVVGYAPRDPKETYPFRTWRFRHQAAAQLQHEGLIPGDAANCSTRGRSTDRS